MSHRLDCGHQKEREQRCYISVHLVLVSGFHLQLIPLLAFTNLATPFPYMTLQYLRSLLFLFSMKEGKLAKGNKKYNKKGSLNYQFPKMLVELAKTSGTNVLKPPS
ncbi:hypothetical protein E2C01_010796 [Portunus trituberculatus]|uniref:Uncharacterized protein n=1 Tax=Portunus trituberculatus TaxID=210409 RepID=A0A5B7D9V0_PORTR|nr:hypothetical protein [Portunus trituberculatus]